VEPISLDAEGALHFGAGSARVDCVVKMRRLPERDMLNHALQHGAATPALLRKVAACIARFHQSLPALHPKPSEWCASLDEQIAQNERALLAYPQHLRNDLVRRLMLAQRSFLRDHAAWIDTRIQQGKMVEAHGDLRAEHVFISNGVGAIDCLEFSVALRQLDCADEIGFLALDCERLAGAAVAQKLLQAYWQISADDPPTALVNFYQSLRAAVRARLAILHLAEASVRPSSEWIARARQWLMLADQHAAGFCSTYALAV
jgi:aminoglycoside phosphotransferase family enzyme